MSDPQLRSLGCRALGDIVTLRHFCGSACDEPKGIDPATREADESSLVRAQKGNISKRANLLRLLRDEGDSKCNKRVTGRPRCSQRAVTIGLRIPKSGGKFHQVKSPLGDKNLISVKLDMSLPYEELQKEIQGVFFKDGNNMVLGDVSKYNTCIVNASNAHVSDCVHNFSLKKYIEENRILGALRLHLLCTPRQSIDEVSRISSDEDEISDQLPDLSDQIYPTQFVNVTPSGEVAFRVFQSQPIPELDTVDLSSLLYADGTCNNNTLLSPCSLANEAISMPEPLLYVSTSDAPTTVSSIHQSVTSVVGALAAEVEATERKNIINISR